METHRKKEGLFLSILVFILSNLLGCTPVRKVVVPTISSPVTQVPDIKLPPSLTALPPSTTPFPVEQSPATSSPGLIIVTETDKPFPTATIFLLCKPGEYEAIYDELVPYADQLLFLAHEVGRIEELTRPRAEEILSLVQEIGLDLEFILVPPCMMPAYDSIVEGRILLESSILAFLDEDPDLALELITETLLLIAEGAYEFIIMSWELTATSTPEK